MLFDRKLKLDLGISVIGTLKHNADEWWISCWSQKAKKKGLPTVTMSKEPSRAYPPGMYF